MRIKLYSAHHEFIETFSSWDRAFTHWLDENADSFFREGGYVELWNDRDVFCFERTVRSRRELKQRLQALAA